MVVHGIIKKIFLEHRESNPGQQVEKYELYHAAPQKATFPQLKKSTQRSRNVSTEDRPRSDDDGLQRRSRSMDAFPKGLPRPSKPTQQGQRRPRPRGDGEVQSNIDVFYQSRTQSCDR